MEPNTNKFDRLRCRAIITSYSILPDKFTFLGIEIETKVINILPSNLREILVDYFVTNSSITESYFKIKEVNEKLLDRISYLSFAPCSGKLISVTKPSARFGEFFRVGLLKNTFQRSVHGITQEDFEELKDIDDGGMIEKSLRSHRYALESSSILDEIKNLWTSIEPLAKFEASQRNIFNDIYCPKCKDSTSKVPAAQKVIREYFSEQESMTEDKAKRVADDIRKFRNTVVHEGKLTNDELHAKAMEISTVLRSVACTAIYKATKKQPVIHESINFGSGFIELELSVTEKFEVKLKPDQTYSFGLAFSKLPPYLKTNNNFSFGAGIIYPLEFHELQFPQLS